jgi:Mrp family chromosome partitioning ATPase/capsular polysaccharide biosynthesis protein
MDKQAQTSEFNLRNIISSIFRQKLIVIILSPPIIVGIFIALIFQTPVFEAKVKMHIVGRSAISAQSYYDIGASAQHRTQMEIVKSNSVLNRAVIALKLDKRPIDYEKKFCHPIKKYLIDYRIKKIQNNPIKLTPEKLREVSINNAINSLRESVSTDLIPGTDIFFITVKDYSAENAIATANVVSRSYVIFDLQQQYAELTQKYGTQHPSVQQLRDNIFSMTEKLSGEQLPELEAIGTASVKVIEQAMSDNIPLGKSRSQTFLIAIIASICISIALAILYDMYIDMTFKSPTEIVKHTGLPLLGSIPIRKYNDEVLINIDKFNPSKSELLYSNFFEDLSDQLFIYMKVNKLKTILITSAFPRGGTSTICANISLTLAQKMNAKTLIIDANFRNPSLHKLFNIKEGSGLSNMLEESKLIEYHGIMSNSVQEQPSVNIIQEKADSLKHKITKKHADTEPIKNIPEKADSSEEQFSLYNSELKTKTDEIINHVDSRLDLLQAGNSSMTPFTLFNDAKIDSIFKITKSIYDAVIIDCTNLKVYKDTGILSSHADGVVLVVNDGKEKRQIVLNSMSYIKQKKGNLFGIILNRRRFPIPEILYKWL